MAEKVCAACGGQMAKAPRSAETIIFIALGVHLMLVSLCVLFLTIPFLGTPIFLAGIVLGSRGMQRTWRCSVCGQTLKRKPGSIRAPRPVVYLVEAARVQPWGVGDPPRFRKTTHLALAADRVEIEGDVTNPWPSLIGVSMVALILAATIMVAAVGLPTLQDATTALLGTWIITSVVMALGSLIIPGFGVPWKERVMQADPRAQPAVHRADHQTFCLELSDNRWVAVRPVDGDDDTNEQFAAAMKECYGERLETVT